MGGPMRLRQRISGARGRQHDCRASDRIAAAVPHCDRDCRAATVDGASEAGPGETVTPAVCVIAVPFAVAETVFAPATVELNVPVATPLASVVPLGCVRVFPLPVAASTTVAPLIG